jgi:hypothetical protein
VIVLGVVSVALLMGLVGLIFVLIKLVRNLDTTLSLDPNITLQEVLKSLDVAARIAAKVAKDLEINLAESRQQFSRLVILLDRMQIDVTATGESGTRMEASGVRAEVDRARVAADLAELQGHARRIEAAPDTPTGAAADFAAGGNDRPKPARTKAARRKIPPAESP